MANNIHEVFQEKRFKLYCIALKYLHNPDDAEDVTQETYVRVSTSRAEITNKNAIYSYLCMAVRSNCIDRLRQSKRTPRDSFYYDDGSEVEFNDKEKHPHEEFESKTLTADICAAIEHLNIRHKEVIILYYFKDVPILEIAKILRIPDGTVKTRLMRARNKLRPLIDSHFAEK